MYTIPPATIAIIIRDTAADVPPGIGVAAGRVEIDGMSRYPTRVILPLQSIAREDSA